MFRNRRKTKHTKKVAVPLAHSFDGEKGEVPLFVEQCIAWLENHTETEGIFRVSGSIGRTNELKAKFAKGNKVDLSEYKSDPHIVSGCLKSFFRELPDPVCTYELYDCFLAAGVLPLKEARVACITKLLNLLPPGNHLVLKRFCGLLKKICDKSDINKMTESNLAIVFAPTLLRRENETMDQMVKDQKATNALVVSLILDYEYIFLGKEVEESDDLDAVTSNDDDVDDDCQSQTSAASSDQASSASTSATDADSATNADVDQPTEFGLGRACWDFKADADDELSFRAGAVIVTERKEGDREGFSYGYNLTKPSVHGWFQTNYVAPLDKHKVHVVQAIYQYVQAEPRRPEILDLEMNDIILVTKRGKPDGWWEGDLDNKHGLFPSTFTEILYKPPAKSIESARATVAEKANYRRSLRVQHESLQNKRAFLHAVSKVDMKKVQKSAIAQFAAQQKRKSSSSSSSSSSASSSNSVDTTTNDDNVTDSTTNDDNITDSSIDTTNDDNVADSSVDTTNDDNVADSSVDEIKIIGLYDYEAAPNSPEISFPKGALMTLIHKHPNGWWEVRYGDKKGYVPNTYVKEREDDEE